MHYFFLQIVEEKLEWKEKLVAAKENNQKALLSIKGLY